MGAARVLLAAMLGILVVRGDTAHGNNAADNMMVRGSNEDSSRSSEMPAGGGWDEATWGEHGSIPPEVVSAWRTKDLSDGKAVPEGSFFDPTSSYIWSGRGGGVRTIVNPARWVMGRRTQRMDFSDDRREEYADGQWWPYRYGVGPVKEGAGFGYRHDRRPSERQEGSDLYSSIVKRYNDPTYDAYMDHYYKALVMSKKARSVMHAQRAIKRLDEEAATALPALDAVVSRTVELVCESEGVRAVSYRSALREQGV
eukprot:753374-Hanusia_phi.AAC.9